MQKLKIGVIGTGHLGKIHIKCIQELQELDLVGFYDNDPNTAEEVNKKLNAAAWTVMEELIDQCDIIDIVTPTPTHFEIAKYCIAKDKHIFIEKPITQTVEEAEKLLIMQNQKPQLKIQVGHVERFNPAFLSVQPIKMKPKFIEVHRLAQFNPRGTDVSVVLDLMIHDLDILLKIVDSPIHSVIADGVAIVSPCEDICNARIEWENGCVANVTTSRLSIKNMRKFRIFQPDAYISIDFLKKESQIISLHDENPNKDGNIMPLETASGQKYIEIDMPEVKENNAIREELFSFYQAIVLNEQPQVSIEQATKALSLAWDILNIAEKRRKKNN